jgi:hypothetical protein
MTISHCISAEGLDHSTNGKGAYFSITSSSNNRKSAMSGNQVLQELAREVRHVSFSGTWGSGTLGRSGCRPAAEYRKGGPWLISKTANPSVTTDGLVLRPVFPGMDCQSVVQIRPVHSCVDR